MARITNDPPLDSLDQLPTKAPFNLTDQEIAYAYDHMAAYAEKLFGPPEQCIVTRADDLDLKFSGWLISNIAWPELNHRVIIDVWLTESRKWILRVYRREGFSQLKVWVLPDPYDLREMLIEDNGGTLGVASKQVWSEICWRWPLVGEQGKYQEV